MTKNKHILIIYVYLFTCKQIKQHMFLLLLNAELDISRYKIHYQDKHLYQFSDHTHILIMGEVESGFYQFYHDAHICG